MDDRSGDAGRALKFELTPNTVSIRYRATGPGILTVTDTWADGWRARVDGRETAVLRVDGVFRGVQIEEPGVHDVVFW